MEGGWRCQVSGFGCQVSELGMLNALGFHLFLIEIGEGFSPINQFF